MPWKQPILAKIAKAEVEVGLGRNSRKTRPRRSTKTKNGTKLWTIWRRIRIFLWSYSLRPRQINRKQPNLLRRVIRNWRKMIVWGRSPEKSKNLNKVGEKTQNSKKIKITNRGAPWLKKLIKRRSYCWHRCFPRGSPQKRARARKWTLQRRTGFA